MGSRGNKNKVYVTYVKRRFNGFSDGSSKLFTAFLKLILSENGKSNGEQNPDFNGHAFPELDVGF